MRKVIKLGTKDIKGCLYINDVALNGLWTKEQWEKEMEEPNRSCYGILTGKELLAFACGSIIVDQLDITAIGVDPRHRRLGYGTQVITKLIEEAKAIGVTNATLEVNEKNFIAKLFYESLGFSRVGYREKYYKDLSNASIYTLPL